MYGGVWSWGGRRADMATNDRFEKSLRLLARTAEGPFQVIAYGMARKGEGEARISKDLSELARRLASDPEPTVVVESADPFSPATARPGFRQQVLPLIGSGPKGKGKGSDPATALTGRGAPARARERLVDITANLPRILDDVDRILAGSERTPVPPAGENAQDPQPSGEGVSPDSSNPPPEPVPKERIPLFIARSFEDLGADAEAVAQAISLLVDRGAHVVIPDEHLDTRTREGRLVARCSLRLGAIKAERARERALAEFSRRRDKFRVYGPIPFGFRREGQELLPLQDQIGAVRRARELAGLGQTPVTIAATLNHEQRPWKDGSRWTWRRVAQVLKNPIYERVLAEAKA